MKLSIIERKSKKEILKITVRKSAENIQFNFSSQNETYKKLDSQKYTVNQLLRMNKSMLTRFLTAISDDSFNALVKVVDKAFDDGSYQSERHYNKFSEVVEMIVEDETEEIEKYLARFNKLISEYNKDKDSKTKTRAVFEYTA